MYFQFVYAFDTFFNAQSLFFLCTHTLGGCRKIPCPCPLCNGILRDPRTVERHLLLHGMNREDVLGKFSVSSDTSISSTDCTNETCSTSGSNGASSSSIDLDNNFELNESIPLYRSSSISSIGSDLEILHVVTLVALALRKSPFLMSRV